MALENLALRQQLAALTRTGNVRTGRQTDYSGLDSPRRGETGAEPWSSFNAILVRWHREWLRRRWTARSRQNPGHPGDRCVHSDARREDGSGESALRCTADSWPTAEARHRGSAIGRCRDCSAEIPWARCRTLQLPVAEARNSSSSLIRQAWPPSSVSKSTGLWRALTRNRRRIVFGEGHPSWFREWVFGCGSANFSNQRG